MPSKQKIEDVTERWERNFIIFSLIIFIILGVVFFVFVVPKISSFLPENSNPNLNGQNKNLSIEPNQSFSLGVKYSENLNYSQALDYFQEAANQEPKNISYQTELASTHYILKNYDKALQTYQNLITLDKENSATYQNRIANIYWIKQDYARAEQYFNIALESDPNLTLTYHNLSLFLDDQGRDQEAIDILKKGIERFESSEELEGTLQILGNK